MPIREFVVNVDAELVGKLLRKALEHHASGYAHQWDAAAGGSTLWLAEFGRHSEGMDPFNWLLHPDATRFRSTTLTLSPRWHVVHEARGSSLNFVAPSGPQTLQTDPVGLCALMLRWEWPDHWAPTAADTFRSGYLYPLVALLETKPWPVTPHTRVVSIISGGGRENAALLLADSLREATCREATDLHEETPLPIVADWLEDRDEPELGLCLRGVIERRQQVGETAAY